VKGNSVRRNVCRRSVRWARGRKRLAKLIFTGAISWGAARSWVAECLEVSHVGYGAVAFIRKFVNLGSMAEVYWGSGSTSKSPTSKCCMGVGRCEIKLHRVGRQGHGGFAGMWIDGG